MNSDLLLPVVTTLGWLILCCVSLASFRLGWGRMLTMALAWLAIFAGVFLVVEWFLYAQGTTSALVYILHNIYYPS